jgi:hypothetical protein
MICPYYVIKKKRRLEMMIQNQDKYRFIRNRGGEQMIQQDKF